MGWIAAPAGGIWCGYEGTDPGRYHRPALRDAQDAPTPAPDEKKDQVTTVVGLNAYHGDSAACLFVDGELLAAAEEERFRRLKHWAGFPSESLRWCLDAAKLTLADVDHIAVNRDPRAAIWPRVRFLLSQRPAPSLYLDRLRNMRAWSSIEKAVATSFPDQRFAGEVHHVEHHYAHLLSAFLVSPFDDAVVVSVDAGGDFASAAWGRGREATVDLEQRVWFPHSLGVFYSALTQFLGFPHYGDENKVMGLAPYGEPTYLAEMREIVRTEADGGFTLDLDYFRHHRDSMEYRWDDVAPTVESVYSSRLPEVLGEPRGPADEITQRHRDLARSVQERYEEVLFHLLDVLHRRHGGDALALAGGCAMNSVANGKIARRTPFTRVYVPPAPGDAGGAIGAALAVWSRLAPDRARDLVLSGAALGPGFSTDDVAALLDSRGEELQAAGCRPERVDDEGELCGRVAQSVADGRVVGWFHGRMEWGPRALGNRSIVCDPRRDDMKEILNRKIKRRESFRPFAPSILREAVGEWFDVDDDVPFMEKVLPVREDRQAQIPSVTHVDGTGRLQTVDASAGRYRRLIEEFASITGVPLVLNTSFNENEPIVRAPDEALACFLRTNMDTLVLEDWILERQPAG